MEFLELYCNRKRVSIEELRKNYINNPPEGMTSKDIRRISKDKLLDLDYFLNENDLQ